MFWASFGQLCDQLQSRPLTSDVGCCIRKSDSCEENHQPKWELFIYTLNVHAYTDLFVLQAFLVDDNNMIPYGILNILTVILPPFCIYICSFSIMKSLSIFFSSPFIKSSFPVIPFSVTPHIPQWSVFFYCCCCSGYCTHSRLYTHI